MAVCLLEFIEVTREVSQPASVSGLKCRLTAHMYSKDVTRLVLKMEMSPFMRELLNR